MVTDTAPHCPLSAVQPVRATSHLPELGSGSAKKGRGCRLQDARQRLLTNEDGPDSKGDAIKLVSEGQQTTSRHITQTAGSPRPRAPTPPRVARSLGRSPLLV